MPTCMVFTSTRKARQQDQLGVGDFSNLKQLLQKILGTRSSSMEHWTGVFRGRTNDKALFVKKPYNTVLFINFYSINMIAIHLYTSY